MNDDHQQWHRSMRQEPLRISYEVWEALRLISKAKSQGQEDTGRAASPDMLADEMLYQVIKEKYPQFSGYRRQVDKMRRDLLKTLS